MSKSAEDWCDEGIELMQDKKFSEAIECFKKVVEIDPKYKKVWLHMGYCYDGNYNSDKAIKCYRKAIGADAKDYEAYYNLGNQYLDMSDPFIDDEPYGDYEQAIKYYKKALEFEPDFSYAWNNMGFCYGKLGNHTKSVEGHSKAVELDPENISAWVNLGAAEFFLGNHLKAIEAYEKAIEHDPGHNMAWICLRTTVESYKNKNKPTPENKDMWVKIGSVYLTLDKILEGIECFKHVIELDSEFYTAWHQLGQAYNLLDDHEEFMECFEDPIEMDINKISIITTSAGPLVPDLFWFLESDSGISIVPSEDRDHNFLKEVQELPGFDNGAVIDAMISVEDNFFLCWTKPV